MKIIADNGEGCTIEEGTGGIDIAPDEAVLVLRPDMTHRLIIPAVIADQEVSLHTLALTSVAMLLRDNNDWVKELIEEVFGEDSANQDTALGPNTQGSA